MSAPLPLGSTIGIIGGGQLGRMLAMAAARLGYRTAVLEPQADCPAAQVANHQITAAYDDPAALDELARISTIVTYEFENVPIVAASYLAASVLFYPPARALEVAPDRLVEKTFFNGIGISTANFCPVENDAELTEALKVFGGSGVLKTCRMGYDGKGQTVFRNMTIRGFDGACALLGSVPLVLESLVPFEREVSVIAARSTNGSIAVFDPAENVHRNGILQTSTVPAAISEQTAEKVREAAQRILSELDYVGVIVIEFFVMPDGALLANEMAPRVHNSGHWTEAACIVSQFEQHMRAVAGLPLGDVNRHSDCVMENLIGDDIDLVPVLLAEPDVAVHLYGKSEVRPGRKMGHFTRISSGQR